MKLAFYKAKYGNFLDIMIAWWCRPNFFNILKCSEFSHVEMLFSTGESFSSSPRDGGTRWKVISYDHKWVIVEIENINEETIKSLCIREENKKYDWFCIFFGFVIPFDLEHPNRWICSEITGKFIFKLKHPHRYDPQKLYDEKCYVK